MEIEFGEIEGNQQQGFLAPVGAVAVGCCDFRLDITPGFIEGFGEQRYVLVRAFNVVKRRFGLIAHKHAFPDASLRGWHDILRFIYSRTNAGLGEC